jgi:hypothetical protein
MSRSLVPAALLLTALAATPRAQAQQTCHLQNVFALPASLPQGGTLSTSWEAPYCGTLVGYTVDLLPDPLGDNPIIQGTATVGGTDVHTEWTVPECQPTGSYAIHVTQGTVGTGTTGGNSPSFAITMGPTPCVYWAKAGSGGGGVNPVVVAQGATLPITWSSQNQHDFKLFLHDSETLSPVDLSAWGGTSAGQFLAGVGTAQAGNFTAFAALSPAPSLPVGTYRVRVAVYKADGTFRDLYTNPFDVTPTLALGNVTVTPAAVQSGGSITVAWGQRNQARYQVTMDGGVVASANGTNTSVPLAVPATLAAGTHAVTVTIWNAANNSTSASGSFTVQRATVAWTAAAAGVPETAGSIALTARLTTSNGGATSLPVTVPFASSNNTATAGQDYTAVNGTLTFPANSPNNASLNVVVPILDDVLDEPDETFSVALGVPANGVVGTLGTASVTITDNDPPVSFTVSDATVVETNAGTPVLQFFVYRSPGTPATVTVNYQTADGTAGAADFIARSGTLTFTANDTSQGLPVSVVADTTYEGNETMTLNLSGPVGGVIGDAQGVGTITDDDAPPALTVGDATLAEGNAGNGTATFPVTLSNLSQVQVTVGYATANNTALAGSDYTAASGTLTIPALAASGVITVPVTGDAVYERDEDFYLNLSAPAGGTVADGQGRAVVTNDDAPPALKIGDASVSEGNSGQTPLTLTVSLSGATDVPASVTCATAPVTATSGVDFVASSQVLSFSAGTTTQTCTVQVAGDTIAEGDEVFTALLSAPADAAIADGSGIGRILDDDRTTNPAPRADFNGDGKTDLIFRNLSSGNHVVWFMDGLFRSGGTLLTPAKPAAGNWFMVGAADFDPATPGADLLWQNTDSGNLALWTLSGTTQASGAVIAGIGVDWKLVATADFNADGKPDFFWRNTVTAETRVWFMDGTIKLGEATPAPAGLPDLNWTLSAAGDLNGDGSPDLVWRNQTSGNVVVWHMNGTNRTDGVVMGPVDLGWQIVGIWDVDSDGHADIVWQEQATSVLLAWFMNDVNVLGSSVFSPDRQVDANWKAVGPR